MQTRVKELRAEAQSLHTAMTSMLTDAAAQGRTLNSEEQARFDKMDDDFESRVAEANRIEKAMSHQSTLDDVRRAPIPDPVTHRVAEGGDAEAVRLKQRAAFGRWLRVGTANLTPEERTILAPLRGDSASFMSPEQRAQSTTDAAGGYSIRPEFFPTLETAMKAYGAVRQAATVIPTTSGDTMTFPTANDTGNTGAILGENSQVSTQDITFAAMTLDAYKYTSKEILVSIELLNDSAFPLESWLADRLAERLGRITNTHFTTGDGSSKPNGIVTASTLGKTGAGGQLTSVIYNDLVDMEHAVDPAYRTQGCAWMFNDAVLKSVKKLVDSGSKPIWYADIAGGGQPSSILGYPYYINQDVAVPAASAKSMLFGRLAKYVVREVVGLTMLTLRERYADYHQVAFLGFLRTDGDLLDAGTHPVVHFVHAGS